MAEIKQFVCHTVSLIFYRSASEWRFFMASFWCAITILGHFCPAVFKTLYQNLTAQD